MRVRENGRGREREGEGAPDRLSKINLPNRARGCNSEIKEPSQAEHEIGGTLTSPRSSAPPINSKRNFKLNLKGDASIPQHITNLILGIAIGECQGFTSEKIVSIMLDILFSRLNKFLSTIWFHICFGADRYFHCAIIF